MKGHGNAKQITNSKRDLIVPKGSKRYVTWNPQDEVKCVPNNQIPSSGAEVQYEIIIEVKTIRS